MTKLVIVESPTKAKTIGKFLGRGYKVESSYGHIRDLPKSRLGIDIENNFEPSYIIPMKSRKRANELKRLAKDADEIILAADEDREGEAIAWHITQLIGDDKKYKRIVFHEITKEAIEEAIKNPRDIDLFRVDAQQARRILDRLVGYELSPFLWKKFFRGLSAGRVQSVALRLIVEREQEIEKFIPQEYWSVDGEFAKLKDSFSTKLTKKDGKLIEKLGIKNKEEAEEIKKDILSANFKIDKIDKKDTKRNPSPPFTTSTLQQQASNRLGFSAKQTMMFAQQLYENGFITYMRTDSVTLSESSLSAAKQVIENNFGKEFSVAGGRKFKTKSKRAQEAHEAIRPSDPALTPEIFSTKSPAKLDAKAAKIYDLIWRRFMASQMKEAIITSTAIDIEAKPTIKSEAQTYTMRANGSTLKFAGWLKVYPSQFTENLLPNIEESDELKVVRIEANQHFTEPLPRYNEASLVKILEEYGIGRPSTYAPIINTIQTRNYVTKNEQRRFTPTEIGVKINNILVEHFPTIVDIDFTANLEEDLDKVALDKLEWRSLIKNFYEPFHKNLEKKYEEVQEENMEEETDEICDKCNKGMVIKYGRFGKFLACSGFPDCKNAKPLKENAPQTTHVKCPECEKGEILERKTRKGKIFFSCEHYPECKYALWNKPTGEKCKLCNALMVEAGKSIKCSNKECSASKSRKKVVD